MATTNAKVFKATNTIAKQDVDWIKLQEGKLQSDEIATGEHEAVNCQIWIEI